MILQNDHTNAVTPIEKIDDFSFTYIEVDESASNNPKYVPVSTKRNVESILVIDNFKQEFLQKFEMAFESFFDKIKEIIANDNNYRMEKLLFEPNKEYDGKLISESSDLYSNLFDNFRSSFLKRVYRHDIGGLFGDLGAILGNKILKFEINGIKPTFSEQNVEVMNFTLSFLPYVFGYCLANLGISYKNEITFDKLEEDINEYFCRKKFKNKEYEIIQNSSMVINNKLKGELIELNSGDLIFLIINILKNGFIHGDAMGVELNMFENEEDFYIEVMDNGTGIDENLFPDITRIFEEGATDGIGKSEGLGIANGPSRMKRNGGSIEVFNHEGLINKDGGRGVKFLIKLKKNKVFKKIS